MRDGAERVKGSVPSERTRISDISETGPKFSQNDLSVFCQIISEVSNGIDFRRKSSRIFPQFPE